MKETYVKFTRQLVIFSLIIGAVAFLAWIILPAGIFTPALPFLLVFFFSATLLSFYHLTRSTGKRFIKFVNAYMLTIGIKLLLYLCLIVAYLLLNRPDAIRFLIAFFVLYLCFSIFEAVWIIRQTRPGYPGENSITEK